MDIQTIREELNRIATAKADIIAAIINKGVSVPEGVMVEDLAEYIRSIGKEPDPLNPLGLPDRTIRIQMSSSSDNPANIFTNCGNATFTRVNGTEDQWDCHYDSSDWFKLLCIESVINKYKLKKVLGANTTTVTDMGYMFVDNNDLNEVALFDTSNVTSMRYMFNGCSSLTTIPLFDTSNVTEMQWMFAYCSNFNNLPAIDTSKVTNMYGTFRETKFASIPDIDTSSVTDMGFMFYNCASLKNITIPNNFVFTLTEATQRMFADCYYVETGITNAYTKMLSSSTLYNYQGTFNNCGMNTTTGAAELAQIPSDWK